MDTHDVPQVGTSQQLPLPGDVGWKPRGNAREAALGVSLGLALDSSLGGVRVIYRSSMLVFMEYGNARW